ncbi:MAG: sigma-54 dependent transcriptional regulator, partial [Candidatus Kapaibacterium sp.]
KIKNVLESSIAPTDKKGPADDIRKFLAAHGIIGKSKAMLAIGDSIIRYGRTDLNVLITGETGTGKKLVAKALHAASRRTKHPFVTVDIPNIPKELFQSELFGHIRGSFSGATETKKGLFHEANKGSIFLDEIGEMTLELQSTLFIPIEEKVVRRVGSVQSEEVDIRFISATDMDLVQSMREGRFREQLYHRLRECEINIPPLSQRREDINDIIEYYAKKHNDDFSESKFFSPSAIEFLCEQQWHGNVRELASVIRVAMQTVQNERIEVNELHKIMNAKIPFHKSNEPLEFFSEERTLKEDLAEVDKKKIENILQKCNGNVSKSAAMLGISRETLHNKIRRYDIDVQLFRIKSKRHD